VGLNATGDGTRSLNVLMHGTDALLALHRVTDGECDRLLETGWCNMPCCSRGQAPGGQTWLMIDGPRQPHWLCQPGSRSQGAACPGIPCNQVVLG
jgi:hypothetical protein